MSISKDERLLTILNAKKEALFSRIQSLYEDSQKIGNPQNLNNFKIRYHTLEETKTEFNTTIDRINDLMLIINPESLPNFSALNSFDELYCHIQMVASTVFESKSRSTEPSTDSKPIAKLPDIELPSFSGDPKDWPIFYECFKSLIHENSQLTNVERINYLLGKLSGSAKNICHGLSPVASNYEIIWNSLIEKYQDKRKLANNYLERIFEFKTLQTESASNLNTVVENFNSAVLALKKLDIPDLSDFMLAYIVLSKLDIDTRRAFEVARKSTDLPSYKEVIDFTKSQAHALSSLNFSKNINKPFCSSHKTKNIQSFVVSKPNEKSRKCPSCGQLTNHPLYKCEKFLSFTPNQRYNIARTNNFCLNCLAAHKIINCNSKINCAKCHLRHHTLLHFEKTSSFNKTGHVAPETNASITSSQSLDAKNTENKFNPIINTFCSTRSRSSCSTTVLLSTVVVNATDTKGNIHKLRFLVDSGSQGNFITLKCCKKLKLPIQKFHTSVIGIGSMENSVEGKTHLVISSQINSCIKYAIELFIMNKISNKIPNVKVDTSALAFLDQLPLADQAYYEPNEIDGILGSEMYGQILGTNKIAGPKGFPVAIETSFGYIVMGNAPVMQFSENVQTFCALINSVENLIQNFWKLEEIPSNFQNTDDLECENIFKSTVKREPNGRYTVALPFKHDPSCLGDSYTAAYRRFISLERKLIASPSFREKYNEAMMDYISQNHISKIRDNEPVYPGYYIPHHGVVKPESTSTQLRIVFDASSKTDSSYSLNDILYIGPKLQADVLVMLLKFRLYPIAMTADIRQMYRQINVIDRHRRYQRLLWRFSPEENLSIYQINTVAFGISSSPYLALRTIHQLAADESENYPIAAKSLVEDMYIDDYCVSVPTSDDAIKLYDEMVDLCAVGGFELVKWSTNCIELSSYIPPDRKSVQVVSLDDGLKVLGLQWEFNLDFLFLQVNVTGKQICTKRNILSAIARLFDPMGIISPIILVMKLLIQDLWILKLGWDEQPPPRVTEIWLQFVRELPQLVNFKIDRHIGVFSNSSVSLIAFADASQKAYGTVIYLRSVTNGIVRVNLLCSKSKVAPLKTISIPRLELCAAYLLAKLVKLIIDTYGNRIHFDNVFGFSDSSVVLHWIHSSPNKWKIFVANRVAKIHDFIPNVKWFHISTNKNMADVVSRGQMPSQFLANSLWLYGPSWLKLGVEEWPVKPFSALDDVIHLEEKMVSCMAFENWEMNSLHNLIEKSSSWLKLLRTVVYVLRFCKILKSKSYIVALDLEKAEEAIISIVQKKHFSDIFESLNKKKDCRSDLRKLRPFLHNNLIRVGGRLSNSNLDFDQQHPILLPKNDHLVNILIDHIHRKNLHTGPSLVLALLRQRYWILNARSLVWKRLQACNHCFRSRPRNTFPLMADLPACRVQEAKPFLHTGTDYAGPLNITLSQKRGVRTQKAYICLFICLVTKAIHIELVSDLSTNKFLLAFKRFISRRGPCSVLYSDSGRNYIGAKSSLDELYKLLRSKEYIELFHNELSERKVEWKFIPPYSPHFGGIWESNIKSVKSHLFKAIGTQILTFEELLTVLCYIEAILNSRPLCALSQDPSDPTALTPAHFLNLTPLKYIPMTDLSKIPLNRLDRFQLVDQMIKSFWRRWHLEYLTSLQLRAKWTKNSPNIVPNTVVLIKQDNSQPLQWPLGIVDDVHQSSDGVIRVVTVRTKHGLWKRPVVKICPLPTQ